MTHDNDTTPVTTDPTTAALAMRNHMLSAIVRGIVTGMGACDAMDIAMGIANCVTDTLRAKPDAPPQVLYALEMAAKLRDCAVEAAPGIRESVTKRVELAPANARVNGKRIV